MLTLGGRCGAVLRAPTTRRAGLDYSIDIDHAAVEACGVKVIDARLASPDDRSPLDPTLVVEILISLG